MGEAMIRSYAILIDFLSERVGYRVKKWLFVYR